ncbi:MAG: heavy metal-associated domain-containing protein [Rhodospirillales bacterium]
MANTYKVLGMSCDGCAKSVTKAIQSAAPGATVEVNLDAKEVSVEGVDGNETIQQAVEKAGFEYAGPI